MTDEESANFESEEVSNVGDLRVLRVALKNESDAIKWITTFAKTTRTEWVKLRTYPDPRRYVYRGAWSCAFSSKNKRAQSKRNLACPVKLNMLIKLNTPHMRKKDRYLQGDKPKAALISIEGTHNHDLKSADTSKLMRGKTDLRKTFFQYFQRGMTPAQAVKIHAQKIMLEEKGTELLNDAHFNPTKRTVYHWHCLWRKMSRTPPPPPPPAPPPLPPPAEKPAETLGSFWENFMRKEMQNAPNATDNQPVDVSDAGAGPKPCSPGPGSEPSQTLPNGIEKRTPPKNEPLAAGNRSQDDDCREKANSLFTEIVEKSLSLHQLGQCSPAYVKLLEAIKDKLSLINNSDDYLSTLAAIASPLKTKSNTKTMRPRPAPRLKKNTRSIGGFGKKKIRRKRIKPLESDDEELSIASDEGKMSVKPKVDTDSEADSCSNAVAEPNQAPVQLADLEPNPTIYPHADPHLDRLVDPVSEGGQTEGCLQTLTDMVIKNEGRTEDGLIR